ncbi:MAG: hypothetical protein QF414_02260 [Arenicellales bacterium]|jgi:hypothetical protein|nr:hypothetical protein [Arenicellales bacterium]|tara:strand:+ start:8017 stop:8316 length:300 start_codon:yes stop_codon:yes gene_type:complete
MSQWDRVAASDCGSSTHATRYESLRDQVLAGLFTESRQGLAVLLRQGLSAWIHTWSEMASLVVPRQPDPAPRPLPDGVSAEVIRVLAAMALGHMTQVHV